MVAHTLLQRLQNYPVRNFSAGDILLYQGEVPTHAYVVKTGAVRAYNISRQGDEKPVSFWRHSDILSCPWVFGQTSSTLYFYEAHTDCSVYYLRREELMGIIHENPDTMLGLLTRYVSLLTAFSLQLHALEYSRASDKILHMLFYLCQAHGQDSIGDDVLIDLPLTQQDLANLLGLTRETTGIELLKLKKSGLITLSKKKYKINKPKLLQMIGETEFEGLRV